MTNLNVTGHPMARVPPNNRPYRPRNLLGAASVFWVIVTSGGVYLNSPGVVNWTLFISVALLTLQIFAIRQVFNVTRLAPGVIYLACLGAVLLISLIANKEISAPLTHVRLFLMASIAFGTAMLLPRTDIARLFVAIVTCLSAISVLLFYTEFPELYRWALPALEFNNHLYINMGVYLTWPEYAERRNLGIFIEPGLFQIYINFALFIALYSRQRIAYRYVIIIILVGALISTRSTAGYILGLVVFGGAAFRSSTTRFKVVVTAIRFVLVIIAILIAANSTEFRENLEDKLEGTQRQSFLTRQNATIIDSIIIADSPLSGGGVRNYQRHLDEHNNGGLITDASTNTFSQLGALFGLPFVLLVLAGALYGIWKSTTETVTRVVFLALYIGCFAAQPLVLYAAFYLFSFLGFERALSNRRATRVAPSHAIGLPR